jgi:acetyltransferase-like isoleucine patch superfamily enzyme
MCEHPPTVTISADERTDHPARPGRLVPRVTRFLGQGVFNLLITNLPGHWLRLGWLRALGAELGRGVCVFRGTTVIGAQELALGDRVQVGFRVVLDARGGLTIGEDVLVSSDSQLLTANHNFDSDDFERQVAPIEIADHAWIATRAMVLAGVSVGRGAVVAAGGVATRDVPPRTVVGGSPARRVGERSGGLDYRLDVRRPPLY